MPVNRFAFLEDTEVSVSNLSNYVDKIQDYCTKLTEIAKEINRICDYDAPTMKTTAKQSVKQQTTKLNKLVKLIIEAKPDSTDEQPPLSDLSDIKNSLTFLTEQVGRLSQQHPSSSSYAAALQTVQPTFARTEKLREQKHSLILKSATGNDSDPITTLKSKITKLKVVPVFKKISATTVIAEFDSLNERDSVNQQIKKVKEITVEKLTKRKPLIILKGIPNDINSDKLVDQLYEQNLLIQSAVIPAVGRKLSELSKQERKKYISLRFVKKNHKHAESRYNAVLEVTGSLRNLIVSESRLAIGYERVHVQDFSVFV